MSMTEEKRQYLFLSEQTLLYNVAVRSRRGEKKVFIRWQKPEKTGMKFIKSRK